MSTRAVKAMERWLATTEASVQANVNIVTPETLGQDTLFHISTNAKIKLFRPEVSRRTASQEDRSVPRVSTAPTVIGCIQGYMADIYDHNTYPEKGDYHGGWYIYGLPFEAALRPKRKILFDAERSDEHWLVPYEGNQWERAAQVYGKFFYPSVTVGWRDRRRVVERQCYVEVGKHGSIPFGKKVVLTEGYWRLTIGEASWDTRWDKVQLRDVEKISVGEYREAKKVSADLLHRQPDAPPSARW